MARLSMDEASIRIRQLARTGLDTHAFFETAGETISRAVPVGGAPPFWNTIDPSSHLITSVHFDGECFFDLAGQLEWEYVADDVNTTADVLANERGVQTLNEVTGGSPERSAVYREDLRPNGIEQEAAVALRSGTGEAWGTLRINRCPGQPQFSTVELKFLRSLAPHLAEGLRRGLLLGEALEPDWPDAPGLILMGERQHSSVPVGAPNGRTKPLPNSFTAVRTASRADVARRSCSSAPLMPEVEISRASCHDSSAMTCPHRIRRTDSPQGQVQNPRGGDANEDRLDPPGNRVLWRARRDLPARHFAATRPQRQHNPHRWAQQAASKLSPRQQLREAGRVTGDDRHVVALIRYLIIQAARDGELQLVNQSDNELRGSIIRLMRDLADSEWEAAIQSEHRPNLFQAAVRFVEEDEADLAIVMYATALEHWLNGMLEVGLKRRGEQLDETTERGALAHKLTTRWHELLGVEFPDELRRSIHELVRARKQLCPLQVADAL